MTNENNPVERRRFLRRLGAALGGLFGAVFGVPAVATVIDPALRAASDSWVDAGPAAAVKEGTAVRFRYPQAAGWEVRQRSAYLVRDGDRIIALSSRCTHFGCTVRFKAARDEEGGAGSFRCPCHGGVFSLLGAPEHKPVDEPLERFETRVKDGQVQVRV